LWADGKLLDAAPTAVHMDLAGLGADLRSAARASNHRRLVVLHGEAASCRAAAADLLAGADVPGAATAAVGCDIDREGVTTTPYVAVDRLVGATRTAVVLACHDRCEPNTLGRLAGVPAGGGLFVLLCPPLEAWPDRRDSFDDHLAVPPYGPSDVGGRFRSRLVSTLRDHPGVAVVDVDASHVERDGLGDSPGSTAATGGAGRDGDGHEGDLTAVRVPPGHSFPRVAYESCLTADQARALRAFERLRDRDEAVVAEADRGRGKSSAAGLAAGCLAHEGRDVLVTAPGRENAREVFARAAALLSDLDALAGDPVADGDNPAGDPGGTVCATGGGSVRFTPPAAAVEVVDPDGGIGSAGTGEDGRPDVVFVDEAAALPVRLLDRLLAAPSAGFVTTVHGYEGAGRGFSVRFRGRLDEYRGGVTDVRLEDPIRYARGDPVESWAFRALLLDARPAVDEAVASARPDDATYRVLDADALAADEHRLREVFGLLVAAHYRTEPDDLARLLDAPNLRVRALTCGGHVVSVALLAREGGLDGDLRRETYDGARIRGHMLPDVLTSQVRDETAGVPVGYRVARIATHAAVRSRGFGSRLLAAVEDEFDGSTGPGADATDAADDGARGDDDEAVDWLGAAYGATPALVRFWAGNGYRTVHCSTGRNETSGEYSVVMVRPLTADGAGLADRHAAWFGDRVVGQLSDPLDDLDPDVARAALSAVDARALPALELSPWAWRTIAGAAYGPGLFDVAPGPFRRLVVHHLVTGTADPSPRQERVLVRKALQAHPWDEVAGALEYDSPSECMRAFGRALRPLVDAYGGETARGERDRYTD
jgi:tRNA(Met) cytidine acetyltransferase